MREGKTPERFANGLQSLLRALSQLVEKTPLERGLSSRLRGKDSNLDYLIQSQASYH